MAEGENIGKAYIEIDADPDNFTESVDEVARDHTLEFDVDLKDKEARKKIHDLTKDKEVKLDADVEASNASKRLAFLARKRTAYISPKIDKKAYAAAEAALMRLSGGRLLESLKNALQETFENIDKVAVAMGGLTTAGLAAVGAMGALASNLSAIVYGLAQIAPLALLIPGLFAGAATGALALFLAIKGGKEELKTLKEEFQGLGKAMSGSFWGQAMGPIQQMIKTLMPTLRTQLVSMTREWGLWAGAVATAMGRAEPAINELLANTTQGINTARQGVGQWVKAFADLAAFGSNYLSRLATALNDLGTRFAGWIELNINNGNMFKWVETGIQQFKFLWSILADTGRVFGALGKAAADAGTAGLTPLANGMAGLANSLNSLTGQTALSDFFKASHDAMAAMAPGFDAFGKALVGILPTLQVALPTAGRAVSTVFGMLGGILSNPQFQIGLATLVSGFDRFVASISGGTPEIASGLGEIVRLAGNLLPVFGQVIGGVLKAFGPVLTSLADALGALAPVLGGTLLNTLQKVIPVIQPILTAILQWVQANPKLAASILLGVVAGTKLIGMVSSLSGWLKSGSLLAKGVGKAFGLLGKAFALLGRAFLLNPIGIVITALVLLGVLLVTLYKKNENFRNNVNKAWAAIKNAVTSVVSWFTDTALPAIVGVWNGIVDGAKGIPRFLRGVWSSVVNGVTSAWNAVKTAVQVAINAVVAVVRTIGSSIGNFWGNVVSTATGVWDTVVGAVRTAISAIVDTVRSIGSAISSAWSSVWNGLVGIVTNVLGSLMPTLTAGWNAIVAIVKVPIEAVKVFLAAAFLTIVALFTGNLDQIGSYWSAAWSKLSGVLSAAWSGITTFFSSAWALLTTLFQTALAAILGVVMSVMGSVHTAFVTAWTNIVTAVTNAVTTVGTAINNGFSAARDAVVAAVTATKDGVINAWNAVVAFVPAAISAIKNGIINGFNAAKDGAINAFNAAKTGIITAITSAASAVANAVTNIKTAVVNGFNTAKTSVQTAMTNIGNAVNTGISRVLTFFRNLPGQVVGALKGLAGQMTSVGTQLVQGLINGIANMAGRVASKAREVVSGAISAAKRALGIKSPSRVFKSIGQQTGQGLVSGINDMIKPVAKAGAKLADAAVTDVPLADITAPAKIESMIKPLRLHASGVPLSAAASSATPPVAGNVTNHIDVALSMDDLAQLQTLDDFFAMLKSERVRQRQVARSGTVKV